MPPESRLWDGPSRAAALQPGPVVRIVPGLALCAVIAMAAHFMVARYGGGAVLYALMLGLAFNGIAADPRIEPGVHLAAGALLKLGVVLLGANIGLARVLALGWPVVTMVTVSLVATILAGWCIGRRLGLSSDHALLSAGAVAICGSSAAVAIAAVLPATPQRNANMLMTIGGVTALSTITMLVLPMAANHLTLDSTQVGVLLGASIHNVAHVLGAAEMMTGPAGESAVIVKLLRVALLGPAVAFIALGFRSRSANRIAGPLRLPWFVIGFVALSSAASMGWVPPVACDLFGQLSSACIVAAMAAFGVRTSIRELAALGRPLVVMVAQTAFLIGVVLAGLLVMPLSP